MSPQSGSLRLHFGCVVTAWSAATRSGAVRHLFEYLRKPEYLFRPSQILRRLARVRQTGRDEADVSLPWGVSIRVCPTEVMGRAIWTTGVYDLVVGEVLWRLTDPGETVVDAGANIGYMTALLARRVGSSGTVWSFEPHPSVFQALAANVERWSASPGTGRICLREEALSDASGPARLVEGLDFAENRGTARLVSEAAGPDERGRATWIPVASVTLDAVLGGGPRIAVLKIDVEGHEMRALRGARRLLESGQIRDIVFEEHAPIPSPVSAFLVGLGYAVFRLDKGLIGPRVEPAHAGQEPPRWAPPSYLASIEPGRALARLRPRGWATLR